MSTHLTDQENFLTDAEGRLFPECIACNSACYKEGDVLALVCLWLVLSLAQCCQSQGLASTTTLAQLDLLIYLCVVCSAQARHWSQSTIPEWILSTDLILAVELIKAYHSQMPSVGGMQILSWRHAQHI